MIVTFALVCALILGACGAPAEYGFNFRSRGKADFSGSAVGTLENGKVSGDASGSASGNLHSKLHGGAYAASDGKVIGVNGGVDGEIGGDVKGNVHGEVAHNEDGTFTAGANSTLSVTKDVGVSGHANIATGDDELRYIAGYKGNMTANDMSSKDSGTSIDLGTMISVASHVIEHFWLYFWIAIGFVILILCCCLYTVWGMSRNCAAKEKK